MGVCKAVRTIFIMCISLSVCCYARANDANQYLKLMIATDKNVYAVNDEIVITAKLTNISDKDVTFHKNGSFDDLRIQFHPVETNTESKPFWHEGCSSSEYFAPVPKTLKPGESIVITRKEKIIHKVAKFNYRCAQVKEDQEQEIFKKR